MTDEETLKALETDLDSPSALLPVLKPFIRSLVDDSRALRELVELLPECRRDTGSGDCGRPGMWQWFDDEVVCDEHHGWGGDGWYELDYAPVLRRIVRAE